jgi:hypothetical protein
MQIEKIFYLKENRKIKNLAIKVAKKLGIRRVVPYVREFEEYIDIKLDSTFPTLEPRSLLIGNYNDYHYFAYFLSKGPLVNIDYHLDCFDFLDYKTKRSVIKKGKLEDYNWVYWVLKAGREVHCVIPRFDDASICPTESVSLLPATVVPKDSVERFKVYCLERTVNKAYGLKKTVKSFNVKIGSCDSQESTNIKIENVEKLEKIKDIRKQISIDLDFIANFYDGWYREAPLIPGVPKEKLKRIINLCAGENDVFDVWLDWDEPASLIAELFL